MSWRRDRLFLADNRTSAYYLGELVALCLLMALLAALLVFAAWMSSYLPANTQPETRCFSNALTDETYCRTQRHWGLYRYTTEDQGEIDDN